VETTLISASGVPMHSFGGDDSWRQYELGGFIVSCEWIEGEPAAAIWPATGAIDRGVYVCCLSAYPHWLELSGGPSRKAFDLARNALVTMGREVTPMEVRKLIDVVIHSYGHVRRMPPQRVLKRDGFFEATTYVNGVKQSERLV
jgi:hypothetical protein